MPSEPFGYSWNASKRCRTKRSHSELSLKLKYDPMRCVQLVLRFMPPNATLSFIGAGQSFVHVE